ncbi:MAG: hypothetical protein JJU31_03110 [Wenzhouxiangella sp.]|nr:hypothetical protein [Wenzhouxiangella sp.]
MSKRNRFLLAVLVLAALASAATSAEIGLLDLTRTNQPAPPLSTSGTPLLRVGPGSNCDFNNLQAAIDAAQDGTEIRVTESYPGTNTPYAVFNKSLTIRGGWSSCEPDSSETWVTQLNAGGSGGVFRVTEVAVVNPRTVNLHNLDFINGSGSDPGNSGGLSIDGRAGMLQVNLSNVYVMNNSREGFGNRGGGINLIAHAVPATSPPGGLLSPMLSLDNGSLIRNNTVSDSGGGLSCFSNSDTGPVELFVMVGGLIANNEANEGAGLEINGCRGVRIRMAGRLNFNQPQTGLFNNQATLAGGGLLVRGAAEVVFGGQTFIDINSGGLITGNSAFFGSAAAVRDQAILRLENTWVRANQTTGSIGTLSVVASGQLEMSGSGTSANCRTPDSIGFLVLPECSVVESNSAFSGSVSAQNGDSRLRIQRTHVRNNIGSATQSASFVIAHSSLYEGPPATLDIIGTLVYDNQTAEIARINGNGHLNIIHASMVHDGLLLFGLTAQTSQHEARLAARASILVNESGSGLAGQVLTVPTSAEAECVLSNVAEANSGFDISSGYLQAGPRFRNAAGADFRLADDSPAIDYCYAVAALEDISPDLQGRSRGQAWTGPPPAVPNPGSGLFDLGALEADLPDRVFQDRFFEGQ